MEQKPVAVFDIDGTVFRSSLVLELIDYLIAQGVLPTSLEDAYAKEREAWHTRRGEYEHYMLTAVTAFREHLKGVSYEKVLALSNELIESKKDRVYIYTRDLIKKLKAEGYFLLAISRSPYFMVEPFGFELGFDKVYGFFYETGPTGAFTGNVEDVELIRNKAAVLQRAVRKEHLTLEGSVGVGDTESDIPMLELVDKAIAFNPNAKLFDHAKKRNWKVVIERKDVVYEI